MKKRKSYSNEYKAKIALEAIKGGKTINEIASEYKVHSDMITKWKKHLLENMAAGFDRSSSEKSDDTEKEELYKQIGKMKYPVASYGVSKSLLILPPLLYPLPRGGEEDGVTPLQATGYLLNEGRVGLVEKKVGFAG